MPLPRIQLKIRFLLPICILMLSQPVAAQQTTEVCEQVTAAAEHLFFNAVFDEAIETLNACLKAEEEDPGLLLDAEKAEIYLLLSRVYFADQQRAEAADALTKLYQLKPAYEMAEALPPPFLAFAADIQEINSDEEVLDLQLVPAPPIAEERKLNNRRWLLIGGSGLFAVTAVAIMSSGRSSTSNVFPPAPGPPGQ
ncbi:MAG: hypothetical protein AAF564_02885 [Bacteroidota bacterium]